MDFPLPPLGEGLIEVELVRWLVKPGDAVGRGQPLMEVMSDKAAMEVPSALRAVESYASPSIFVFCAPLMPTIQRPSPATDSFLASADTETATPPSYRAA